MKNEHCRQCGKNLSRRLYLSGFCEPCEDRARQRATYPFVPTYRVPKNHVAAATNGTPKTRPTHSPLSPANSPTSPTKNISANGRATHHFVIGGSRG